MVICCVVEEKHTKQHTYRAARDKKSVINNQQQYGEETEKIYSSFIYLFSSKVFKFVMW
jgi:hypothetical protein